MWAGGGGGAAGDKAVRLPSLLRILHASQPLASAPTLRGSDEHDEKVGVDQNAGGGGASTGLRARRDRAVAALEYVAASHPSSDLVEAVAVHFSAEFCRRVGRCRPLKRIDGAVERRGGRRDEEEGEGDEEDGEGRASSRTGGLREWDEERLNEMTAAASGGGTKKRKRAGEEDDEEEGAGRRGSSGLDDDDDDDDDKQPAPVDPLHEAVAGIVAAAAVDDATAQMAAHKRMVAELLPAYQKMAGGDAAPAPVKSTTTTATTAPPAKKKKRASAGGVGGSEYSELSALFRSAKSAEEDSVRSGVGRTLAEVAGLVAAGLRNPPTPGGRKRPPKTAAGGGEGGGSDKDDEQGDEDDDDEDVASDGLSPRSSTVATVALPLKSDSVLAEPTVEDGRAAAPMGGADLPATVSALMHFAPVLRHEHLANALCRSAVPRGPEIVASLAANCPPASPCLLRGCVDAHLAAASSASSSVSPDGGNEVILAPADGAALRSAEASIRRLAALSPAEGWGAALALGDERRRVLALPRVSSSSSFSSGGSGGYAEGAALALDLTLELDAEAAAAMMLADLAGDYRRRQSRRRAAAAGLAPESKAPGGEKVVSAAAVRRLGRGESREEGDGDGDSRNRSRPLGAPRRRGRRTRRIRPPRRTRRRMQIAPPANSPVAGEGLADALSRNPDLAARAGERVASCLEEEAAAAAGEDRGNGRGVVWGRAALLTRSFAALAHEVGFGPRPPTIGRAPPSPLFVLRAMKAVGKMASILPSSTTCIPPASPWDEFHRAALCACAVTLARLVDGEEDQDGVSGWESKDENENDTDADAASALGACLKCLKALLRASVSRTSDAFASRIAGAVLAKDGARLGDLVREVLFGVDDQAVVIAHSKAEDAKLRDRDDNTNDPSFGIASSWASSKIDLHTASKRGWLAEVVAVDGRAALAAIDLGQMKVPEQEKLLKDVFIDPAKCAAMMRQKGAVSLIFSSIMTPTDVSFECSSKIPLLLPLQVEQLARKVSWNVSDLQPLSDRDRCSGVERKDNQQRCQFVLQLLYALRFAQLVPGSPFAVDPRLLPGGPALLFCRALSQNDSVSERLRLGIKFIGNTLEDLAANLCPEILSATPDGSLQCFEDATSGLSSVSPANKVSPTTVATAIRACLQGGEDPSGRTAERLFLNSRADFPSADVDVQAFAALLSSQHSPLRLRSYSSLCRDPLALLRCNVRSWRCRGLRRILLSILRRLLDAHDFVARKAAVPSKAIASEMLASRDALVARCLLVADSCGYRFDRDTGGGNVSTASAAARCPMAVSLIRSLVSKRRGLVAILVKQGLPDTAVDLLAELVPESLADAPELSVLLSERNNLTAAERLSVADASLRIVIAHGASAVASGPATSNDSPEARTLAFAAMSVLVSSFFLVLGPVGVPVDAVCEEGGKDLTSSCRNATFRMIEAMQHISCHRSALKNEARMALGKIAGLCMSEGAMSGVAGAAATKRKALLKELWDLTMRSVKQG